MSCNARKDVFKCQQTESCDACFQECAPKQNAALKRFVEGWPHFCDCIDFGKSALDAEAIRFMNEVPLDLLCAFPHEKA